MCWNKTNIIRCLLKPNARKQIGKRNTEKVIQTNKQKESKQSSHNKASDHCPGKQCLMGVHKMIAGANQGESSRQSRSYLKPYAGC